MAANGTAIGRKRTCQYQQKENPVLSTIGDKLLLVTTEPSRCRSNNQDLKLHCTHTVKIKEYFQKTL